MHARASQLSDLELVYGKPVPMKHDETNLLEGRALVPESNIKLRDDSMN